MVVDTTGWEINALNEIIERQDEQIERLKEEYMILQNASDEVEEEKDKEIERLNNIINEFEDWLNAKYEETHDIWYVKVLNKLQELKRSDKK